MRPDGTARCVVEIRGAPAALLLALPDGWSDTDNPRSVAPEDGAQLLLSTFGKSYTSTGARPLRRR